MCGEMAGNPLYTAMLLGMGLRKLSMSPLMIPEVKERVRAVRIDECEAITERLIQVGSREEIRKMLIRFDREANQRQAVPYLDKQELTSDELAARRD